MQPYIMKPCERIGACYSVPHVVFGRRVREKIRRELSDLKDSSSAGIALPNLLEAAFPECGNVNTVVGGCPM